MGCCSLTCYNHIQSSQDLLEDSFSDISIESSVMGDKLMQEVQIEDASLNRGGRLRSISCASIQLSTHLETAFLYGTQQDSEITVSLFKKSVN